MSFLTLLLTALGLAADCFAVAVSGAVALCSPSRTQVIRTALAFGLAQFVMPVVGWAVGQEFVEVLSSYDHWVAFGLLALVGAHMLRESFRADGGDRCDITRGVRLVVLAVATSIDALAVGLSLAFLETPILLSAGLIGSVAFGITIAGFALGVKLGEMAGQRARLIGGLLLIGIGVKIVLEHTVL